MVQKIHPQGVIWVPSSPPHAGHLSEKNDDLAVQYEDVHDLVDPCPQNSTTEVTQPFEFWCLVNLKYSKKFVKTHE